MPTENIIEAPANDPVPIGEALALLDDHELLGPWMLADDDPDGGDDPSPLEIVLACKEIQAEWSERERKVRAMCQAWGCGEMNWQVDPDEERLAWSPPTVKTPKGLLGEDLPLF